MYDSIHDAHAFVRWAMGLSVDAHQLGHVFEVAAIACWC